MIILLKTVLAGLGKRNVKYNAILFIFRFHQHLINFCSVTPIVPGSNLRKLTSLIFQYPKTFESSEAHLVPEQAKILQETGIKPIMPMPELKAAPKMMIDITISKPEIIKKVLLQIEQISTM